MWCRWLCAVGCSLALIPAGCFWLNGKSPNLPTGQVRRVSTSSGSAQRVVFDTRLLEQPVGESYLTRGLWTDTTDPLPHQLSALLASNGIRVGLLSGPNPAKFDRLATGEGTAIAPTLRQGLAGQPKPIPINGPLDRCSAEVIDSLTADKRKLTLSAAECAVVATGTPEPNGKVTVRCQLLIQHGDKRAWWNATNEGGFERTDERSKEDFPTLVFDVSLGATEALVIAPTADPGETLGELFFFTPDQAKQRALVLRVKGESSGN